CRREPEAAPYGVDSTTWRRSEPYTVHQRVTTSDVWSRYAAAGPDDTAGKLLDRRTYDEDVETTTEWAAWPERADLVVTRRTRKIDAKRTDSGAPNKGWKATIRLDAELIEVEEVAGVVRGA